MASKSQPPKCDGSSIKYWRVPLEVQSFEPDTICSTRDDHVRHSVSHAKSSSKSEVKSSIDGVSTSQLVSTAAGLWGCICHPAVFQTKASFRFNEICQKESIICYPGNRKKYKTTASAGTENDCHNIKSENCSSSTAMLNFGSLKTIKKSMLSASCNRYINNSLIWRDSSLHAEYSSNLTKTSKSIIVDDTINFSVEPEGKGIICMVRERSTLADLSAAPSTEVNITSEGMYSSADKSMESEENSIHPPNTLYSAYSLQPLGSAKEAIIGLKGPTSGLHPDYNIECFTTVDCIFGQCQEMTNSCSVLLESSMAISNVKGHKSHESDKSMYQDLAPAVECSPYNWLSIQHKLHKAFPDNRHALAGAFAGTMVSLCLHPVDTVKTVIQANCLGQKSFCHIFRTIISEKGVFGLYRGVASNIASSAPISAIYTYTYESVKGALLPLLPKEFDSFAHCIAGGSSSVATSIIFTPSERIKQQMQVGSQYQNCWNALIGCLGKGGVPSLYAGWGAVLCRNIPHSIIKFYTYESLKQLFLASPESGDCLNTMQTLLCGGLAGSTAALFSTPFDVVKTRLQTQPPGSLAKYNGVLHAVQEIAREEGFLSLYRGLTTRLVMYVSQGAIFFASYEFLKAVFSFEAPGIPILGEKKQKAE